MGLFAMNRLEAGVGAGGGGLDEYLGVDGDSGGAACARPSADGEYFSVGTPAQHAWPGVAGGGGEYLGVDGDGAAASAAGVVPTSCLEVFRAGLHFAAGPPTADVVQLQTSRLSMGSMGAFDVSRLEAQSSGGGGGGGLAEGYLAVQENNHFLEGVAAGTAASTRKGSADSNYFLVGGVADAGPHAARKSSAGSNYFLVDGTETGAAAAATDASLQTPNLDLQSFAHIHGHTTPARAGAGAAGTLGDIAEGGAVELPDAVDVTARPELFGNRYRAAGVANNDLDLDLGLVLPQQFFGMRAATVRDAVATDYAYSYAEVGEQIGGGGGGSGAGGEHGSAAAAAPGGVLVARKIVNRPFESASRSRAAVRGAPPGYTQPPTYTRTDLFEGMRPHPAAAAAGKPSGRARESNDV